MAPQRSRDRPASKTLPERVGQLYYAYGLFCASHPIAFISFACAVVILCCYPLLNLPLPGNVPQHHASSVGNESGIDQGPLAPVWFSGPPLCYVQQIIIKSAVLPWTENLVLTDAFRAPLSEVFTLLENIRNYQHENSSQSLSHVCLHVEAIKSRHAADRRHILPEYNCLVLSPANLWQQDFQEFQQDSNLLSTIFSYVSLQKSKMSLAEMLFGLKLKDTGIKRYPLRTRQRTIQYAVTLFLQNSDEIFIQGLRKRLSVLYPLHQEIVAKVGTGTEHHVYYPGELHWRQLLPLSVMYIMLFLYVYFSVRKVELVRSKVGMALSAVATTLASLLMSAGLCFFFGLTLTINWREMYPYLVMVVGLENVLVLTKSVLSTPMHLDVKIRVAQGLSKEGWSITNNLLTEVTILTFGLLTFVPAIQRFCIFAVVGLLSDFFLQMSFFATVLSIYIHRQDNSMYRHSNMPTSSSLHPTPSLSTRGTILRSKSHPRLNGLAPHIPDGFPTTVVAPVHYAGRVLDNLPKRLRLVHFWARTRFFQRSFMLFMIAWIAIITYNSDAIESFFQMEASTDREWDKTSQSPSWGWERKPQQIMATSPPLLGAHNTTPSAGRVGEEDISRLRPNQYEPWDRLSPYHWATILSMYNISASGRYISILPAILISHAVTPQDALRLRNPDERAAQHFQWQTLAAALDPLDFSDGDIGPNGDRAKESGRGQSMAELPLIPSSPMELFLLSLLCVVSVVVLAYFMVLLYRCVCSRNYAEWRTGWLTDSENSPETSTEVVLEAVPLVLEGHPQEVECISSDGSIIVSSCLAGQLRVWDAISGEPLAVVDRKQYFTQSRAQQPESSAQEVEGDDGAFPDFELSSTPSFGETTSGEWNLNAVPHYSITKRHSMKKENASLNGLPNGILRLQHQSNDWSFPDLRPVINTNFTSPLHVPPCSSSPDDKKKGYDFGSKYRELYHQHHSSCSDVIGADDHCAQEESNCCESGIKKQTRTESISVRTSLEEGGPRRQSWEKGDFSEGKIGGENATLVPPIWCLDCWENLVVVGCANGLLEFWEGASGRFKCLCEDPNGGAQGSGVTAVKLVANRVVAARLSGSLDFFALESYSRGRPIDWGFTAYRRTHVRSGSAGSLDWDAMVSRGEEEDIRCVRLHTIRAHQQPITVLHTEGGRVLTGSQDHTLKVFRLEDQLPLYTLHGHCGPITCLFIDRISPMTAGSGSQDGLLCVWDLLTGACMYSIQAHDGAVLALTYSASYVISLGADERLCVWERFQGHHLNTIQMAQAYCSSMAMLTHSLLLTSRQGSLVVWDVRAGEPVRMVRLGHSDSCVFVKQLLLMRDSVVCDYGNQLRIVRFPLATDKTE